MDKDRQTQLCFFSWFGVDERCKNRMKNQARRKQTRSYDRPGCTTPMGIVCVWAASWFSNESRSFCFVCFLLSATFFLFLFLRSSSCCCVFCVVCLNGQRGGPSFFFCKRSPLLVGYLLLLRSLYRYHSK